LGITDFTTISADALDVMGNDVNGIVGNAVKVAEETAKNF
jgi:FMN-dependent NADH-azoreductase